MSRSGRSSSSSSTSSSHSNTSNNSASEDSGGTAGNKNIFKNDGSFLEMFKKMQEAKDSDSHKKTDAIISCSTSAPVPVKLEEDPKAKVPPVLPMVGKRRGGRALPTGLVKKAKKGAPVGEEEQVEAPKDAWSQYMAEVKRYKEASCEEEGKTRPLVK